MNIEYDNVIKDKNELIKQLESLKEEAIYMMRNPFHDEVFKKDLHALKIVLHMLEGIKNG